MIEESLWLISFILSDPSTYLDYYYFKYDFLRTAILKLPIACTHLEEGPSGDLLWFERTTWDA